MLPAYLEYWGLKQAPFSLAPNPRMFYLSDQHRECLMRLKFAIHSGKGGALLISENAGNGKTTTLNLLMRELSEDPSGRFRIAYLDYPTMTPEQMVGEIARQLGVGKISGDKVADMNALRDLLRSNHVRGLHSLVIVDEGQMMADRPDLLQEFRILLNCCSAGEFLLSFILSGQAPLEPAVRAMPEFWQRLPVRFFLKDLHQADTSGMIRHRLAIAGATRDIFTPIALEGIYRYSKGCPRVICAVADLALVVGHSNQSRQADFAEVSQACSDMEHSGSSYHYFNFLEGGVARPAPAPPAPQAPVPSPPVSRAPEAPPRLPTRPAPTPARAPARAPAAAVAVARHGAATAAPVTPEPRFQPAPEPEAGAREAVEEACPACGVRCRADAEVCPRCAAVLRVACGKCGSTQAARRKACSYCAFPLHAWAREAEREFLAGLKRLNLFSTPEQCEDVKFRHHRTLDGRVLYFAPAAGVVRAGARVREVRGGQGGRFKGCGVLIGNRRLVLLEGKRVKDVPLGVLAGCDIVQEQGGGRAETGVVVRHRDVAYEISLPVREGRRAGFYRLLQAYFNRMRDQEG
ncbi:MAG: AAA family ATPase [Nitrospirae bacterium]|nr:AAA family ATPase [Nitrospirota bacterium]